MVHPQRRPGRGAAPGAARPGQGARLAPALHAGPLRRLGQRAQRRLAGQPAALLRRALPGLVPARRRRRARPRRHPSCPTRRSLPVDPTTDVPEGYAAEQRGVAGRLRRRPRRHGHLGHLVGHPADRLRLGGRPGRCSRPRSRWTCGPRATRSSAPGSSRPCCARTWSTASLPWRHTTINGWILDPDRKKMSKSKGNVVTPMPTARGVRLRRRALLGLQRPARDRHRRRHGRHEDRPPAGHQGPQRVEVRAGPPGRGPGPGVDAVREPLDAALLAQLADVVDAATAAHDGFDYARALELTETFFWSFCDDYVELVKTRAYGEGERRRRRLGPGHAGAGPLGAAPALRPVPPLRDRGGLELVAGGLGAPGAVARRRRGRAARRRRPRRADRGGRGARRGAPREDGQQALHAGPGGAA